MARNLVRFDPFAEITELQKQFFGDGLFSPYRSPSTPTTDVYTEDDKQLTVETYLPNFDESDISINVDNGALVLQAEKHEKVEDKKKKYVMRESSTSFYRRIALPEQADEDKVSARFEHGVLTVKVPFVELPAPKKVEIRSGASTGLTP